MDKPKSLEEHLQETEKYRIYFDGFDYYPQYKSTFLCWSVWRNFGGGDFDSETHFDSEKEAEQYILRDIRLTNKAKSAKVVKYLNQEGENLIL